MAVVVNQLLTGVFTDETCIGALPEPDQSGTAAVRLTNFVALITIHPTDAMYI